MTFPSPLHWNLAPILWYKTIFIACSTYMSPSPPWCYDSLLRRPKLKSAQLWKHVQWTHRPNTKLFWTNTRLFWSQLTCSSILAACKILVIFFLQIYLEYFGPIAGPGSSCRAIIFTPTASREDADRYTCQKITHKLKYVITKLQQSQFQGCSCFNLLKKSKRRGRVCLFLASSALIILLKHWIWHVWPIFSILC